VFVFVSTIWILRGRWPQCMGIPMYRWEARHILGGSSHPSQDPCIGETQQTTAVIGSVSPIYGSCDGWDEPPNICRVSQEPSYISGPHIHWGISPNTGRVLVEGAHTWKGCYYMRNLNTSGNISPMYWATSHTLEFPHLYVESPYPESPQYTESLPKYGESCYVCRVPSQFGSIAMYGEPRPRRRGSPIHWISVYMGSLPIYGEMAHV
jgi:hypothetical protein